MDEVIKFRVDADEKKGIEAEAKKLGLTVSAFLRLLIRQWPDGIKLEKIEAAHRSGPH